MKKVLGLSAALLAALALGACGSSAPSDSTAAHCLTAALLGHTSGTAYNCYAPENTGLPTQCTHTGGNQFTCVVSDPQGTYSGRYGVSDDGTTFSYKRQ